MKSPSRKDLLAKLAAAGMNPREADLFCRKGNRIDVKVIQIPGQKAAQAIPLMATMGLIQGVVTVRIAVESSRVKDFTALIELACGQKTRHMPDRHEELLQRTVLILPEEADPKTLN